MFTGQTNRMFILGAAARLVDSDDGVLRAWAEDHVRKDPYIKWILGNFVEAGRANSNGHIFKLSDLLSAQETLINKPLNMLHQDQYVVGAFAGSKLLTPTGETMTAEMIPQFEAAIPELGDRTADAGKRPYMEALAGMWHTRFDDEYKAIKRAHGEGSLFFSMEAIPPTVTCPESGCGKTAEFIGLTDEASPGAYCAHINGPILPKVLDKPNFVGGAIIIPPVRPGWKKADITAISKLAQEHADTAEGVYLAAKNLAPHLGESAWETVMAMVLQGAELEGAHDAS